MAAVETHGWLAALHGLDNKRVDGVLVDTVRALQAGGCRVGGNPHGPFDRTE